MKAAVINRFGGPEELQISELDKPVPGPGQLLVKVHTTNVNPIDWKIREGQMAARYGEDFPMVLGWDCSGTVEAVGDDVESFAVGDEVFARSDIGAGGCYAEYALINVSTAVMKPASMSHTEAGSVPLVGLTAFNSLQYCAGLQAGQHVLIIGGSGGVGTVAIQIAKNMGAEVTATCSGKNVALVKALGADHVIDYTQQNPLASDTQYDVVYDTVCIYDLATVQPVMKPDGIYVILMPVPDVEFFIPGQTEREAGKGYFVAWAPKATDLQVLADWIDDGKLEAVIDSVYPLEDIQAAHERNQTERCAGKIVIRVSD